MAKRETDFFTHSRARVRQARLSQLDLDSEGVTPVHVLASGEADVFLSGQSAAIPSTPLVIPPETRLFHISYYVVCSNAGAGALELRFSFDDGVTAKTVAVSPTLNLANLGDFISGGDLFLAVEGLPIYYEIAITGLGGGAKYVVFLRADAFINSFSSSE